MKFTQESGFTECSWWRKEIEGLLWLQIKEFTWSGLLDHPTLPFLVCPFLGLGWHVFWLSRMHTSWPAVWHYRPLDQWWSRFVRAYCDPNIIANNKENSFQKPTVPNNNSSQTLKPLRNPQLRTHTITSSLQLLKLKQSQNIFDYNVFYTWFVIHNTSKIICNKPNIATT